MITEIKITGHDYRIEEPLKKYVEKRLGKLDRYLPRGAKKDVMINVSFVEVGKNRNEKFEVAAAMELTGGKVIAAKDECTNVFAGVDLIEAKLTGQIRRYKLEMQPHRQKKSLRDLFIKRR